MGAAKTQVESSCMAHDAMEWQRHFERHATPQMGCNCVFEVHGDLNFLSRTALGVSPLMLSNRVGEDVDGEGAGGGTDGIAHPVAAVLGVIAAEEGAADAAGNAVEAAGSAVVDEMLSGDEHVSGIGPKQTHSMDK